MIRIVLFTLSAFISIFALFSAANFFMNVAITLKLVAVMIVFAVAFALYLAAMFNGYLLDQQEFSKPESDQS